jgi:hypothetical protein
MQVEIGEEWTLEFDGPEVRRLQMARVEPDPTNHTLPLGYGDLASGSHGWQRRIPSRQPGCPGTI